MTDIVYAALLCAAALLPPTVGCMAPHRGRLLNLALAGVWVIGGWAGAQAARLPLPDVWTAVCAIGIAGCAGAAWALLAGLSAMYTTPDAEIGGTVINLVFALPAFIMGGGNQDGVLSQTMNITWLDRAFSLFIPLGFLLALLMTVFLYLTKRGIGMRAACENPGAAAEAGAGAYGPRIAALLAAGCLSGISGLAWRLHGLDGGGMQTGGMALLALAALAFGRNKCRRAAAAAILLAALRAMAAVSDTAEALRALSVPRGIWQMLPYAAALMLCLTGGRRAGEPRPWLGYGCESKGRNTV